MGFSLVKVQVFGIFFVVSAASVERTVLAPLNHQRGAAAFALFVRRLLHTLDVFHVLLGVFEILGEFLVEVGEGVGPLLFAFFDLVEFFFQASGVQRCRRCRGSFRPAGR